MKDKASSDSVFSALRSVALALLIFTLGVRPERTAQAQPIPSGSSITFTGTVFLNAPLPNATAIVGWSGAMVMSGIGAYAGTASSPVTFNAFSFNPFVPPVPFLWNFSVNNTAYSFYLLSNTSMQTSSLTMMGSGVATITGYNPTLADWTFSAFPSTVVPRGEPNGPAGNAYDFIATTSVSAVPEGGAATGLLLSLGMGLVFLTGAALNSKRRWRAGSM